MTEKTPNIGWVYFVAVLFFAVGLTIFLWKDNSAKIATKTKTQIPASGIFIVPSGGKEVSRDTTGYRANLHNIGDRVITYARNPEALYLVDEDGEFTRIKGKKTTVEVCSLGKKDYVIFTNFGSKTAKVKVKIIPRCS